MRSLLYAVYCNVISLLYAVYYNVRSLLYAVYCNVRSLLVLGLIYDLSLVLYLVETKFSKEFNYKIHYYQREESTA